MSPRRNTLGRIEQDRKDTEVKLERLNIRVVKRESLIERTRLRMERLQISFDKAVQKSANTISQRDRIQNHLTVGIPAMIQALPGLPSHIIGYLKEKYPNDTHTPSVRKLAVEVRKFLKETIYEIPLTMGDLRNILRSNGYRTDTRLGFYLPVPVVSTLPGQRTVRGTRGKLRAAAVAPALPPHDFTGDTICVLRDTNMVVNADLLISFKIGDLKPKCLSVVGEPTEKKPYRGTLVIWVYDTFKLVFNFNDELVGILV